MREWVDGNRGEPLWGLSFSFGYKDKEAEENRMIPGVGTENGFSFLLLFWCAGIWGGVSCGAKRGKTSSFSLGKKKQKPERHARSGKSRESPHFRCGRARSRDVGCHWGWPRPACASPPRNWASGFACTPLRRRSAFAGSWLQGRDDCRVAVERKIHTIGTG